MASHVNLNIFDSLHHVCIVVHDIEKAVEYYESVGVGPWQEFPSLLTFKDNLDVSNRDDFMKLNYRYANLANVQIQLCAPPPGDTPQRRFLEEKGEGVFHLGFNVEQCNQAEQAGIEVGLKVLMRGRKADGGGFTYFDTASQGAGVMLEIRASQ